MRWLGVKRESREQRACREAREAREQTMVRFIDLTEAFAHNLGTLTERLTRSGGTNA
jgi:hypothetical protein